MTQDNKNVGWVSDSVTQQNRSPITDQEANMLGYAALSQSTPNLLPNDWCEIPTADTFRQISTNNKKVKTKDCKTFGKYPVIDQGQEDVAGFIDDEDRVIEVLNPLVIFGDHTRIIKWVNHNFVPGADGTKILEPATFVNPRYFYYQLKSVELPDKGYSRHFKYLNESTFRVAPFAEQHQIAAKLDELLAQVDSIKTRLETIPKILKRFRQSVLAAAVSGKLTEDWRENNTHVLASKSLSETKRDKKAGRHWGSGEVVGLNEDELASIPSSWVWTKVKDLNRSENTVQIGPMSMKSKEFITDGIPVLNVGCVQYGYFVHENIQA